MSELDSHAKDVNDRHHGLSESQNELQLRISTKTTELEALKQLKESLVDEVRRRESEATKMREWWD